MTFIPKRILCAALALLFALCCAARFGAIPAQAQILTVHSLYRVVKIDTENARLGVALLDAEPDVVQRWVYFKLTTKVHLRTENDGWQNQEDIHPDEIFENVAEGSVVRVNGGRNWDSSITAKDLIIYPDNPEIWENDENNI